MSEFVLGVDSDQIDINALFDPFAIELNRLSVSLIGLNLLTESNVTNAHTFNIAAFSSNFEVDNITGSQSNIIPSIFQNSEAEDDFAGDSTTTGSVVVDGSPAEGRIDFDNDVDWFAVNIEAGDIVRFRISSFDVTLGLDNSFGNVNLLSTTFFREDGVQGEEIVVSVSETGVYFVTIDGFFGNTDYTVTAEALTDDFSSDNMTEGQIVIGEETTGRIDFQNDVDWFMIPPINDDTIVRISVFGVDSVSLVNSQGNLISFGRSFQSNGVFGQEVILDQSLEGNIFLAVEGFEADINYTISSEIVIDDFTDDEATSGILALDTETIGSIDFSSDEDWFAINLEAGDNLQVNADRFIFMDLLSEDGSFIAGFDSNGGGLTSLTATINETGLYFLSASSSVLGDYGLSTSLIEDDFANDASTTGQISVGEVATGRIDFQNDRDWFLVNPDDDGVINITVLGTQSARLVNANGNSVVSSTGGFTTPEGTLAIDFFIDRTFDEPIYLEVASNTAVVDYTITSDLVDDDFARGIETAGLLPTDGLVSGNFDFDRDSDWFAIELTAGEMARIVLETDTFASLVLVDQDGSFLDFSNFISGSDGSTQQELIADVSVTGTYFVAVDASGVVDPTDSEYTLSSSLLMDDFSGDSSTTGILPLNGTATGRIDFSQDSDWFRIEVEADDFIRITLDNPNLSLSIVDGNGNFIDFGSLVFGDEGAQSVEIVTQFFDSGEFFINVEAFGSPAISYTLTSELIVDDFSNDSSTTGILPLDGTAAGRIDFSQDSDWFRIEVEAEDFIRFTVDNPDISLSIVDENGNFVAFGSAVFDGEGFQSVQIETQFFDSGEFFINVESFGPSPISYILSSDLIVDDFSSDETTVGRVERGSSITGSIDFDGDEDWFAVTLSGEEPLSFMVLDEGNNDFFIELIDSTGSVVASSFGGELLFDATLNGEFFVAVSLSGGFGNGTANYELFANLLPVIEGTSGDDVLIGTDGDDFIDGLSGDDIIIATIGSDEINGGDGNDTYDASSLTIDLLIDLNTGSASSVFSNDIDTLLNIENIISGSGNDIIGASDFGSEISSGSGTDRVIGGAGEDIIFTGADDDTIIASLGSDTLDGGQGLFDLLSYADSFAAINLDFVSGVFSGGFADGDIISNVEMIVGTAFDDTIIGNEFTFRLEGGAGDDTIIASENSNPNANNILIGGSFLENTVIENSGDDTLIGGAGRDLLIGFDGSNYLDGGDGVDVVFYNFGPSTNGGTEESVRVNLANGTASGGHAEGDTLLNIEGVRGSRNADELIGDANNNLLFGDAGGDVIEGGAGDDLIIGGQGFDVLTGGEGADEFSFDNSFDDISDIITDFEAADSISFIGARFFSFFGQFVELFFIGDGEFTGEAGQVRYFTETVENDPILTSQTFIQVDLDGDGIFDDNFDEQMTLFNVDADLVATPNDFGGFTLRIGVLGTDDRDALDGTSGNDVFDGMGGRDIIFGNDGNDILLGGSGDDTLIGGNDNDQLFGDEGEDVLLAGRGDDLVDGGAGDDFILGASGDDIIRGGEGNDIIDGQANNDTLFGGLGVDTIDGGNGHDIIEGGDGNDFLRGGIGNDRINGGEGDDYIGGASGDDFLVGGRGSDRLFAGQGNDTLFGEQNNDLLVAGAGNDFVNGGGGNDTLLGQNGDDIIEGGSGNNILTGGAGSDLFVFADRRFSDIITDFTDGEDLLDLSDFSDAEVQNALDGATFANGDTSLTFSNGSVIVIQGFDLNDLSEDDILGFGDLPPDASV